MGAVVVDPKLVAYCGLYCAACGAYKKGKCPGCAKNEKAGWCKVRACCIAENYASCADCKKYNNALECKHLNSFIAKIFGFIFRSDRIACVARIKELGTDRFAQEMAEKGLQSIKKQ